jgi:uroporphyrinogen-III decarboxylase
MNTLDVNNTGGLATIEIFEAKNNQNEVSTYINYNVHKDERYNESCNSLDIDKNHLVFCGNAGSRTNSSSHTINTIQLCNFDELYVPENKT